MAKLRKQTNQPPRHSYNLRSRVKATKKKATGSTNKKKAIQTIGARGKKPEATTCVICLEKEGRMSAVKCGHRFHSKCINSWLKESDSCPVCRFRLRKPNYSFFCIMTSLIVQTPSLAWSVGRDRDEDM